MSDAGTFLNQLQNSLLIGDGAMGTALFSQGIPHDFGVERCNLYHPEMVAAIHAGYVAAGSQVIETNTFGATTLNLAGYGDGERTADIIAAGVKIAKAATKPGVFVAGALGQLPVISGEMPEKKERIDAISLSISALADNGADLIIFESFTDLDMLCESVELAKRLTGLPVVAQMAFGLRGDTLYGVSAAEVWRQCRDAGADVVGANCGMGAPAVLQAIRKMPAGLPLSAFLNAGFPEQAEGRMIYHAGNDYLAARALEAVNMGVKLIGGCCGTTPEIIRAIADKVRGHAVAASPNFIESPRKITVREIAKTAAKTVSFPLYVELDSPSDAENSVVFEAAMAIKESGATSLTVADNPLSTSRADSLFFSYLLSQQTGIPVVPHLTGRDRNRIALRSGLLAAALAGITSVLCVTGDPIRMCEEPNTTGVFDLTSVGLVRLAAGISPDNPLTIGVAVNPNVRAIHGQIDKLLRKVEAGASFALSQPIFEIDRWHAFLAACVDAGVTIPIYPGIMPFTSARNAEFLHNEVPGINIPAEIRDKLSQYTAVADQRIASVDICTDMAAKLKTTAPGLYFICPRSIHSLVTPVLRNI